jgi:hypothetical protein
VNSLEGMILELEYLMDHEPESGTKQIALLHQNTRPLRLPHSKTLPLFGRMLAENDMSDVSISAPSPSNHAIMFGLVP